MSITVFLADDHAVVRDGLRALLEAQGDIRVVGEASTGAEALRRLNELSSSVIIDVAIVDIAMPEMNGIDVTREITASHPSVSVVILSMYSTAEHIARAFQAGARAFLVKESAGAEVVNAVRTAHSGGRYVSGRIASGAVPDSAPLPVASQASPLAHVTKLEREILGLLAAGRPTREIARVLRTSVTSVEATCAHLMQQFTQGDLGELARFASTHGFASSEQTRPARGAQAPRKRS